jgi:hypothetical protein
MTQTVKSVAANIHDWISESPFFNWRWSLLDAAVIAILVIR